MYRLMIVDDEAEIREGLIEAVDFPKLGFTVVGVAENGIEGLRLAEAVQPDLIITDIRMPLMDGLLMAENIKKILPTAQFLILSGYDEFEYARQAIGISALNYILKPISKRELIEIMEKVKGQMDGEFQRRTDLLYLREHFEKSLPVMRESLLNALAAGDVCADVALESARRYGMPLDSDGYALAIIRLSARSGTSIEDKELLSIAVKDITLEVLKRRQPGYTFYLNGQLAVLLTLCGKLNDSLTKALGALDEIAKSARRYVACPLIIGVSAPVAALSMLKTCAEQAATALGQATMPGEGQVVSIQDVAPGTPQSVIAEEYLLKSLSDAVKMGDETRADSALQKLLAVPTGTPMTIRDYRAYLLEILMTFMRIGRDLDIARPPDSEPDIYEQLLLCPPVDRASALLKKILAHFAKAALERRVSSSKTLAEGAADYIEHHFSDEDISLEKVAGELHISASYLSAIVRRELNRSFGQLLTDKRMDTAMNLLVSTDMKTAGIAEAVGIADPSYFSYAFKKHFGVSPLQARKGLEAQDA